MTENKLSLLTPCSSARGEERNGIHKQTAEHKRLPRNSSHASEDVRLFSAVKVMIVAKITSWSGL
jgi:hypothetical protein